MSIINEQIELSEVILHGNRMAETAKIGYLADEIPSSAKSRLTLHSERKEFTGITSGYHLDHQYPDNRPVFDGQNIVTSETGIETINNSKTAGVLG